MIKEHIFIDFKTDSETYRVYDDISYSELGRNSNEYFAKVENSELAQYFIDEPTGKAPSGITPSQLSERVLDKIFDSPDIFCDVWNSGTRAYEKTNLASDAALSRPAAFDYNNKLGVKVMQNLFVLNNENGRGKEDYGVDFYEAFNGAVTHISNSGLFARIDSSVDKIMYYTVPTGQLYYVLPDGTGSIVLNAEVDVSIFFAEVDDTAIERSVLINPVIEDIPETKAGNQYDPTVSFLDTAKYGFGQVFPPNKEDPKNVGEQNKEFALLETNYNHNTNRFEAGTRQILVRIVDDIAACNTPGIDFTKEDTVDSLLSFYIKDDEENQVGEFDETVNTGYGVVLNKQKNNMYLWGPNFQTIVDYAIEEEDNVTRIQKEKVFLVNRTGAAFVKNELAFASKIDGEWIPIKIAQGNSESVKFGVQKWSFQKLIASADDFFRDARYLDDSQPDYVKQRLNPQDYEVIARNRFYYNLRNYAGTTVPAGSKNISHLSAISPAMLDIIGYMNLGNSDSAVVENQKIENWDFIPSDRYIQVTAFDQMGDFAGGKNKANVIARTNYIKSIDTTQVDTDPLDPFEMIEYWGPTFPRGYSAANVDRLISKKNDINLQSRPIVPINESFFFTGDGFQAPDDGVAITDTATGRNVSIKYKNKGMFYNNRDTAALQLPADAGTNGPPNSTDFSPIERLQYLDKVSDVSVNAVDSFSSVFDKDPLTGMQARYNWLYRFSTSDPLSGIMDPVYGFKPNSPNNIHFYPLAAEVVSSTDYNRHPGAVSPEPGVVLEYGMLPLMAKATEIKGAVWHKSQTLNGVDHLLGSDALFIRNKEIPKDFIQYSHNGFASAPNSAKAGYTVPYFGYVTKKATGKNSISLPTIWPDKNDENASCVGIIASKCRITFRGTELKFVLDQQFGLQLDSRATLSTGGSFDFLNLGGGVGIPTVGGSSFSTSNSNPRWGGLSDEPNVFNTTALHVKVFDSWPDNQTVYDAKYFSVFHFNPGEVFSKATLQLINGATKTITINDAAGDPHILDFPLLTEVVDFKVVTNIEGNPFSITKTSAGLLGQEVDMGTEFAPQDNWRVNTIRRGMMLTGGGFRYFKTYCGISTIVKISGGTNYKVDDELGVSGGAGIGAIVKVKTIDPMTKAILTVEIVDRGTGFVPADFTWTSPDISTYRLRLTGGSGTGAEFRVTKGVIYGVEFVDEGPKNKSNGYMRLTNSNSNGQGNQGTGFVTGVTEQFIPIEEPNKKNEYDLFFYFHNDITHTVHQGGGNMLIEPQRVSMEISAQ